MSDIKSKNTEPRLYTPMGMSHVYAVLVYEDRSDPENPTMSVFNIKPYLDKRFDDLAAQIDELKKLLGA